MRIISLVPSLTEYLWALGLEQEVVGITKFCIHPKAWWQHKTRVGGTKKVNFETIDILQPTLIIANKEENTREDVELLQSKYEVLLTDITTLHDAFFYLEEIGNRVNREMEARVLVGQIKKDFQAVGPIGKGASFLYFIWKDPYFVVGPQTYIHALLTHFGLVNCCEIERYPDLDQVRANKAELSNTSDHYPDYIFLSSEPFPFEAKHIEEAQALFPKSRIVLIDGEICSWYGSRMRKAPAYLEQVLGL
jgi:ABC-type Fe3+-hydroxamate transport system substrate-binding protein